MVLTSSDAMNFSPFSQDNCSPSCLQPWTLWGRFQCVQQLPGPRMSVLGWGSAFALTERGCWRFECGSWLFFSYKYGWWWGVNQSKTIQSEVHTEVWWTSRWLLRCHEHRSPFSHICPDPHFSEEAVVVLRWEAFNIQVIPLPRHIDSVRQIGFRFCPHHLQAG